MAPEVEETYPQDPERWTLNFENSASLPLIATDSTPILYATEQEQRENPSEILKVPAASESSMAFQRSDPCPFIPENLQWVEVENRVPVARAVVSARPPLQNEDLAIVNIDNLPGNAIQFQAVEEVLTEFFHERRIHIREIQPSTLGQALVRFHHRIDRDSLVSLGPIPYLDVHLTFTEHNRGRNWRRAYFNTEVWLMLLEFPADYWEHSHIQNALSSFGKLLHWRNDRSRLARLILKARVLDLQSVPQFIVLSDTLSLESDSWTVQCEILQSRLLGEGPQDEDPMPIHPIPVGAPFDFFGLGQPGNGPIQNLLEDQEQQEQQEGIQNQQQFGPQVQNVDNLGWDLWPQPQQQQEQVAGQQELQVGQHGNLAEINLNLAVEDVDDPIEVILNPANQLNHDEFLELNDLINNADNEEILIHQAPEQEVVNQHQQMQGDLNFMAQEQHLMNITDLEMQHFQVNPDDLMENEVIMAEHEILNGNDPDHPIDNQNLGQVLDLNVQPMEEEQQPAGNWQPILQPMVQPDELIEGEQIHGPLEGNHVGEEGADNQAPWAQNLQVGRVLTFGPEADPVWAERSRTAKATRLWARLFAQGNADFTHIAIPSNWTNFFTAILLSPNFYNWAKEFLSSKTVSCLGSDDGVVDFHVPEKCPKHISCATTSEEELVTSEEQRRKLQDAGSTPRKKSAKKACPIVETELRRSSRGKQVNPGFKKGTCSDRRCLFCSPNPPTLSKQTIRKLGKEIGQLDEEQLHDDALLAKRGQKKPVQLEEDQLSENTMKAKRGRKKTDQDNQDSGEESSNKFKKNNEDKN